MLKDFEAGMPDYDNISMNSTAMGSSTARDLDSGDNSDQESDKIELPKLTLFRNKNQRNSFNFGSKTKSMIAQQEQAQNTVTNCVIPQPISPS